MNKHLILIFFFFLNLCACDNDDPFHLFLPGIFDFLSESAPTSPGTPSHLPTDMQLLVPHNPLPIHQHQYFSGTLPIVPTSQTTRVPLPTPPHLLYAAAASQQPSVSANTTVSSEPGRTKKKPKKHATKRKPYGICPECKEHCKCGKTLYKHIQEEHPENLASMHNLYICDDCKYATTKPSTWRNHKTKH